MQANFTPYVISGEKKKEYISRVCEEVCTFQPLDSDKTTLWGNKEFIHEDRFEEPDFLTAARSTTFKEMFKAEFSEGECHQENCLSSAKLGYGAGHQFGEDIASGTYWYTKVTAPGSGS